MEGARSDRPLAWRNTRPAYLYFKYEWKVVDRIENLNEEDFDNLMATIKHLRVVLHK
ncbi:MAG TPA: hypothetical protein VE244_09540 [Nitrososphaeraceae archaeon]|nr:hypothetical protein [Nitrososphaeraceae archaeon]